MRCHGLSLLFVWFSLLSLHAADEPVTVTDLTWHDAARHRDIPVRIYSPNTSTGPVPVLLFSHGLGGSRAGGAYLGRYWAAHGYISVHVQHPGSDTSVATSIAAAKAAMHDLQNFIDRPKDISFAIDQLTALNAADGPWKNRFDLSRIGMSGHSFGAYTTMAIAGEKSTVLRGSQFQTLADPRVKAAVALSTPHLQAATFEAVHMPVFHITGTEDISRIVGTTDNPAFRRIPFDQSSGPNTYLVIFKGADHMVFGGGRPLMTGKKESNAWIQQEVCVGTTAFWDAYLKGDAKQKDWFANGGYVHELGDRATFEKK